MNSDIIHHSKPWLDSRDRFAVEEVLYSGMIACGKRAAEFADNICRSINAHNCRLCQSGTDAIIKALELLNIREGDEVIIPTYACSNIAYAISTLDATPVFCDISEKSWIMSTDTVKPHITSKTKAIIVIHLFGISADVDAFKEFNIPIIEDCAQAFKGKRNDKYLGTIGDMGVFSFHATKCLTTGEGGAIVSNTHNLSSINTNFSDLQAALGASQLSKYDEILSIRKNMAKVIIEELGTNIFFNDSMYFRFPFKSKLKFNTLKELFWNRKIHIRRGVDQLVHRNYGLPDSEFPNAVKVYNQTFSIPFYPALTNSDLARILDKLKELQKDLIYG